MDDIIARTPIGSDTMKNIGSFVFKKYSGTSLREYFVNVVGISDEPFASYGNSDPVFPVERIVYDGSLSISDGAVDENGNPIYGDAFWKYGLKAFTPSSKRESDAVNMYIKGNFMFAIRLTAMYNINYK